MKPLLHVCFALAAALTGHPVLANDKTIELAKLIEVFMTAEGERPQWSMWATEKTPAIQWETSGVDECQGSTCGTHVAWRRGRVRVTLNGQEMQHLRTRLEPITWEISMASTAPARFGPELVEIAPKCDTVACYFSLLPAVPGITASKLCHAGPGSFRQTGYLLRKASKRVYVVYSEHEGSGGASSNLTLLLTPPSTPFALCAEARAMESAPRTHRSPNVHSVRDRA